MLSTLNTGKTEINKEVSSDVGELENLFGKLNPFPTRQSAVHKKRKGKKSRGSKADRRRARLAKLSAKMEY